MVEKTDTKNKKNQTLQVHDLDFDFRFRLGHMAHHHVVLMVLYQNTKFHSNETSTKLSVDR